jgi:hypothetical protein
MNTKLQRGLVGTAAILSLGAAMTMGGCNNGVQGGLSGAALGSLAGMGLGSLTGNMGVGAAAGAILGGLGGAIIGDQNARSGTYVDYGVAPIYYGGPPAPAYYPPPAPSSVYYGTGYYVRTYHGGGPDY